MDKNKTRRLDYHKEKGTGTWLTGTRSNLCNTVLWTVEWRNEICDLYEYFWCSIVLQRLQYKISITHALDCKIGGLIHFCYDKNCNSLDFWAGFGFKILTFSVSPMERRMNARSSLNINRKLNARLTQIVIIVWFAVLEQKY